MNLHENLYSGERQVGYPLSEIRIDHQIRYSMAAKGIKPEDEVLDICCGVGYGSYILATKSSCKNIQAFDVCQAALDYAREKYSHPKITYNLTDVNHLNLPENSYDKAVLFEGLEHVENDKDLLKTIYAALRHGGKLFLSVPNEEVVPFNFSGNRYHLKHYTIDEILTDVFSVGFSKCDIVLMENRTGVTYSNYGDTILVNALKENN